MIKVLDVIRGQPIDKWTPQGIIVGTAWTFESIGDAMKALVKYGYHNPMQNEWFILINPKESRYKPTTLKIINESEEVQHG